MKWLFMLNIIVAENVKERWKGTESTAHNTVDQSTIELAYPILLYGKLNKIERERERERFTVKCFPSYL